MKQYTVEDLVMTRLDKRLKFVELWLLNNTRNPKWPIYHRTYERLLKAKEAQDEAKK